MAGATTSGLQGDESSASRFTGPLVRSWPSVLLLVAYGALMGALFPSLRPVAYVATAEVLLRPVVADPASNQRADQLVSLDTEAVVIGSDPVLTKAAEVSGLTLADLRKHLKVNAVPTSQVLRVSQRQESPRQARLASDAVTTAYLAQRQERARQLVANEVELITAQIAGTDARLNDLSGQVIASPVGSAARASLQSLQSSTAQQLAALQTRLFALQRTQIDSGTILRASDQVARAGFGRSTTFPAGVLVGLLAGIVFAIQLEHLSRTMRRSADAVRATGHRVLAVVADEPLDPDLAQDAPEEAGAPAYRRALLALEPGEDAVVAVVGTGGGEAVPVSSGLATVAARGGSDVALLLLASDDVGEEGEIQVTALADLLAGASAGAEPAPSVMVGGGRLTVYVGDPSLEEFATPLAVASAAARLRAAHDLVVVEVDDHAGSELAEAWVRCADRTVITARLRHTRTGPLRALVAHLDEAGRPTTGTILLDG